MTSELDRSVVEASRRAHDLRLVDEHGNVVLILTIPYGSWTFRQVDAGTSLHVYGPAVVMERA